jgi:hypothetical protein
MREGYLVENTHSTASDMAGLKCQVDSQVERVHRQLGG